ncbi:hypothetical protein Syun_005327 [Stephania yunnanensis]|uniref:Filament-like plant protein 4 n=1 Tax=Stephania yunnanensis TaxID=152371 RepID=A0AAP0Q268_9MAGN
MGIPLGITRKDPAKIDCFDSEELSGLAFQIRPTGFSVSLFAGICFQCNMERRGWPWKKKSSEKISDKNPPASDSLASAGPQGDQLSSTNSRTEDKPKKVNYVQLSMETYTHLTSLEDEVKSLNDQITTLNGEVDTLNEKLSSAQSEMTTKENLVKQHAKVAEEAVSGRNLGSNQIKYFSPGKFSFDNFSQDSVSMCAAGWEKAEAEATALKHQLESVTLLKLTAEDRASHLDGALKECMRQIRNNKEEHEKKLNETIIMKTKQWDKIKLEFEAKMAGLDQELLRFSAENSALSRSLQERSNMLMKVSEEKSHAEAEIELLKTNIQSCEREISSLKYELHIASKELDIRNEEKNMSMKSAEVANKQHLDGVKKIAKLEAECQRLRGLVRKKLPGPAALAQMKLEVESLGRDHGETRMRRSPSPSPSHYVAPPPPELSLESVQQCHKETEFLTGRLLAMEEETKMLKEALAKRNSELQASRNMCAKTVSKLRSLEAQVLTLNQYRNTMRLNGETPNEGSLIQYGNSPPSLTSMSEDGADDERSCAESWATGLISDLSSFKKEKSSDKLNKVDSANQLELMDDFLEMERLACLPTESNVAEADKRTENESHHSSPNGAKSSKVEPDANAVPLSKLQSRISMIFESEAKDADMKKVVHDIRRILQDVQDTTDDSPDYAHNSREVTKVGISSSEADDVENTAQHSLDQELATAISHIHDFVLTLGKKATEIQNTSPDGLLLSTKVDEFSDSVNKVLCRKMSLNEFIFDLSHVFAKASELSINLMGYKGNEGETNSSDCVDKVTLLEKMVVQDDSLSERYSHSCVDISQSTGDPEVPREGSLSPGFDLRVHSSKCSLEDVEQLKHEKETLESELALCTENLEKTKCQLQETEQLLSEIKTQLASSEKSNGLAETQLKCMAESYRSLEMRAQNLEAEVNLLQAKTEALDKELEEEKQNHLEALAKCKDLQEELERKENSLMCSPSSVTEEDVKLKQEREIAAAAEKLAECQETIFLLSKQLKGLRPSDQPGSPYNERIQRNEVFLEDEQSPSHSNSRGMGISQDSDHADMETVASSYAAGAGSESPSDVFNSSLSASEAEVNRFLRSPVNSSHPKHRPSKSSSSSSTITLEKQSRGFSRFFSSKPKAGH